MSTGFPRSAPTSFGGKAPPGYIAGIGRGAVGFSTRSDIGPGTSAAAGVGAATLSLGAAPSSSAGGRGQTLGMPQPTSTLGAAVETYDQEDAEADNIYNDVDARVDGRSRANKRKQSGDADGAGNVPESNGRRPRIGDQFSDLKAGLGQVSVAEWDALPEVGDHSLKLTQKGRFDGATVSVPDRLLSGSKIGADSALHRAAAAGTGDETGTKNVLAGLAAARESKLGSKLDRLSDDVGGQTVVDPRGYMTGLGALNVSSDAEVGDVKRARLLLSSVTNTNPQHAQGWIAAARLEEVAGKSIAARRLAEQGCEACPTSEDLWLECARLHDGRAAQAVLARAVVKLPLNVKIWIAAAALENELQNKKVVLRRALELVPRSVELWRAAIELEDAEDAKILLGRAVECVPQSMEMWLALVRLESHTNARQVLNRMRQVLPSEPLTWLTAARLEEAHGAPLESIRKIIDRMLVSLKLGQVVISREAWIAHSVSCEAAGALGTCKELVRTTIGMEVASEDRLDTWLADAESLLARSPPQPATARAVLDYAVGVFPAERGLWKARVDLERHHGMPTTLMEVLRGAVDACPHTDLFWLMAAKHAWKCMGDEGGGVSSARAILSNASAANPKSEAIWLAGAKLEWESNEPVRARGLLAKARIAAPSARVFIKSALLEREQKQPKVVLDLVEEGLKVFPNEYKLYLIGGQTCEEDLSQLEMAHAFYKRGTESTKGCATLWVHLASVEEKQGRVNKARASLETGRSRMFGIPGEELLWLAGVRLERRTENTQAAATLLARALQRLPTVGSLWAEDLLTCPKPAQKTKSIDAMKRCDNDAQVVLAIGKLFAKDRKTEKARKWLERAVALQNKLGDAWVSLYSFELQVKAQLVDRGAPKEHQEQQQLLLDEIEKRCTEAEPNRGELWNSVQKRTENRRKGISFVLRRCVEISHIV